MPAPPPTMPRARRRAAKNVFSQKTRGLDREIAISEYPDLGALSQMGFDSTGDVRILVDAGSSKAAKLVGLTFQLMAISETLAGQGLSADRAATLVVLLIATGLLDPALAVGVKDVEAAAAK